MALKDHELNGKAICEAIKKHAGHQYNVYSDKYDTQWAFTEKELDAVVQTVLMICHVHSYDKPEKQTT